MEFVTCSDVIFQSLSKMRPVLCFVMCILVSFRIGIEKCISKSGYSEPFTLDSTRERIGLPQLCVALFRIHPMTKSVKNEMRMQSSYCSSIVCHIECGDSFGLQLESSINYWQHFWKVSVHSFSSIVNHQLSTTTVVVHRVVH